MYTNGYEQNPGLLFMLHVYYINLKIYYMLSQEPNLKKY